MSKADLRKIYKEKRKVLFDDGKIGQISDRIVKILKAEEFYKNAKNILLFYPKKTELNVLSLCKNSSQNFFLPKVFKEEILPCPYKPEDELILSPFKILEPKTTPLSNLSLLDIIITPALCADKEGFRLGYGGGYYDRFFKKNELNAKKIVIIPEDFLLEKLPNEPFDIPCDYILTEKNLYKKTSLL